MTSARTHRAVATILFAALIVGTVLMISALGISPPFITEEGLILPDRIAKPLGMQPRPKENVSVLNDAHKYQRATRRSLISGNVVLAKMPRKAIHTHVLVGTEPKIVMKGVRYIDWFWIENVSSFINSDPNSVDICPQAFGLSAANVLERGNCAYSANAHRLYLQILSDQRSKVNDFGIISDKGLRASSKKGEDCYTKPDFFKSSVLFLVRLIIATIYGD